MARKAARRGRGRKARPSGGARRKARRPVARRSRAARKSAARARARAARKPARKPRANATRKPAGAQPSGAPPVRSQAVKVKRPALDRKRRTLAETVPTPPSSLDLDRHGSAARTGRAELREKLLVHTETGPALTGGDVDADWEEAYSSGDEAPGGDNPTPDASVVDDIGRSLGVEYNDNEELRSTEKIDDRDAKRWELDPASSEDYRDRTKK